MCKILRALLITGLLTFFPFLNTLAVNANSGGFTDKHVISRIIGDSISGFEGATCPCPYHRALDGTFCGERSIWGPYKIPGKESPICYPSDVTQEMIMEYRMNQERRDYMP